MTDPDIPPLTASSLTASTHWEWRPGMLAVYNWGGPARDRYLCTDKSGVHLVIERETDDGGGPLTWIRKRPESFARDCRPDLDDDATCGCLLTLVRKAWGGRDIDIAILSDGYTALLIQPHEDSFDEREVCIKAASLGLALAAALLAAPPRTEGP